MEVLVAVFFSKQATTAAIEQQQPTRTVDAGRSASGEIDEVAQTPQMM